MKDVGFNNGYTMSTGKHFYACTDNLSIDNEGQLAYGDDGRVNDVELTPAEKREVAEYMLDRWRKWAGL